MGICSFQRAVLVFFLSSNAVHAFAPSGRHNHHPARAGVAGKLLDSSFETKLRMQPNYETSSSDDYQSGAPMSLSSTFRQQRRDSQQPLRAVAVAEDLEGQQRGEEGENLLSTDGLGQVLSGASLVTGSTVGAGMLILPSLAAGPGFAISTAMFLAIYALVVTSGLVIADVAINQHESGYEVPSSFQEFAQANLGDNAWMAKGVSAIPVAVNSLVLVFAISKAGDLLASLFQQQSILVDPTMASLGFMALLGTCLGTLTGKQLSAVTSVCVTTLLVAFGGILLPGLANVQDPMATLMAPGTAGDEWMSSVATAAPVVLTALQFQNVVPSLTKILDYDRSKTVAAIALGSFLPLAMYVAWCFAVLGGGDHGGVAGPLMTVFAGVTLLGSSIGASMSVTEEVETFVAAGDETTKKSKESVFSPLAVLLSLAFPLAGVYAFSNGNDASAALGVAGAFGSPLLYGILPAMMTYNQRQQVADAKSLVPGGLASVGALGAAAAIYVGEGLATHVTDLLAVSC
ncbi:Tryptophan-specific transport protein [Seminavis robusta]|uniref:Tryptophan-specific transport protein n=1 Tax=Seminavis robusta TaxID=568900 RepID=A0A9N8E9P7_9STRA|nr:Tryptophan-specific transport protein [Seminavis robusta]|eukprot:Sro852_g210960.1 Tryptophan-specific transport protein (516) ;mRNA; f:5174-6721